MPGGVIGFNLQHPPPPSEFWDRALKQVKTITYKQLHHYKLSSMCLKLGLGINNPGN